MDLLIMLLISILLFGLYVYYHNRYPILNMPLDYQYRVLSEHIERTIAPKNADPERTHLNQELIVFPDGVHSRTEAIQHRLDTAGLKRKIGKNQVLAIRILLTGSHDDMKRIDKDAKLDD